MASIARASYQVEIAWDREITGYFTIGSSLIGGPDVIAPSAYSTAFSGPHDDVSDAVDGFAFTTGANDELTRSLAGSGTVVLRDPAGLYSRENPASALYGRLDTMRPARITATGPVLFRDQVVHDRPRAYYRLGEPSGTRVYDYTGRGPSLAVNGATLAAAGGLGPNGDTDYAISFDGGDWLQADDWPLRFAGVAPFTLEAVVRPTSLGGDGVIFSLMDVFVDDGIELVATSTETRLDRITGGTPQSVFGPPLAVGSYQTVAVHFDGSHVHLIVDGEIVSSLHTTFAGLADVARTFRLGASAGGARGFVGRIDEASVYDYAVAHDRLMAHAGARASLSTMIHLFYGFTKRIQWEPAGRRGFAQVELEDLLLWLSRTPVTIPADAGPLTTGDAVGQILDAIEWTEPAMRRLQRGDTIPAFAPPPDAQALAVLEGLLLAERGYFYVDAHGCATYIDRNDRQTRPRYGALGSSARAIAPGLNVERIRNVARVTRAGGVEQVFEDETSIRRYGRAEHGAIETPYLSTDAEALSLASRLVFETKDPAGTLHRTELDNRTTENLAQILGRGIHDRVVVDEARGGTDGDYFVEQIGQAVDQRGRHTWRAILSKRDAGDPFVIGKSTIGGPDVLAA